MTRFDPSANAQALLGGVHAGISLAAQDLQQQEFRHRQEQDALLARLRMAEADREQLAFEKAQRDEEASRQYLAQTFGPQVAAPTGTESDFFQPGQDEVTRQQQRLAMIPSHLQAQILAPRIKQAQLMDTGRQVEEAARQHFPDNPAYVQTIMDNWWDRNVAGMDETASRMMRAGQMPHLDTRPIVGHYMQLGYTEDEARRLAGGFEAMHQGMHPSEFTRLLQPTQMDMLNARHDDALEMEGVRQGNRLDLLNDRQAAEAEMTQLRGSEWDRRNAVTNQQVTERQNAREDRIDRRNMATRSRRQDFEKDPKTQKLKRQVESWQREFENERAQFSTAQDSDDAKTAALHRQYMNDALEHRYAAENELDAWNDEWAKMHPETTPSAPPAPPMRSAPTSPAAAPAPGQPAPSIDPGKAQAALLQAQKELGPNATRDQIKARARELLGGN